jgi:hypothetical protein
VVYKTGSVGQSQIRIWLLTTDSILNLDTTLKMHSEIGFATILSVKADPEKPDAVQLRLLDREDVLVVRTDWRDSLVSAISDALPSAAYRQDDSRRIHSLMEEFSARGGVSISGTIPEVRPRGTRAADLSASGRRPIPPEFQPRSPRTGGEGQLSPRGSPRLGLASSNGIEAVATASTTSPRGK